MSCVQSTQIPSDIAARLQAVQDGLAELSQVPLCVLDREGRPVTIPSNPSLACHRTKSTHAGYCLQTLHRWVHEAALQARPLIFCCHMGLTSALVPLGVAEEGTGAPKAFLWIGGVTLDQDELDPLAVMAGGPGAHPDEAGAAVLSPARFRQVVRAIGTTFNLLFLMSVTGGLEMGGSPPDAAGETERPKLTRREEEIARLVGMGLSNREISRRLFLSAKTVKSHITNILRKWRLSNRTELALLVAQN